MLEDLERQARDRHAVDRLRAVLRAGCWCWPPRDHPSYDYAREITGLGKAPGPGKGVPVVTVNRTGGSLWCLGGPTAAADAAPGPRAHRAWENAVCALPRSLPVLWSSLHGQTGIPPLQRLGTWSMPDRVAGLEDVVEGPSLGLASLLSLASRVLHASVPCDTLATAAIDPLGIVGPVEGLELKIQIVIALAPGVHHLVVAAQQEEEARHHADGRLEVVSVRSAGEALDRLLGRDRIARSLVKAGKKHPARQELLTSLFRLVLSGRRELVDWSPVEQAARQALEGWQNLSREEKYVLEFAAAVAGRHEGNRGELSMPPRRWLELLPAPLRLGVLANVVQHSADTGEPKPGKVLALARPHLPRRPRDAYRPQLHLAGAVARLEAFRGKPRRALKRQRDLARAHMANLSFDDVSLPLCEWLRLAGALEDRAEFESARAFVDEATGAGALGPSDRSYIGLAILRGWIQLREPKRTGLLDSLRRLSRDTAIPDHVRWSAGRWRIRCARQIGHPEDLKAAEDDFVESCSEGAEGTATYRLLAQLDVALADDDKRAANQAVKRLHQVQSGLMRHLLKSAPAGEGAAWVCRFFPY